MPRRQSPTWQIKGLPGEDAEGLSLEHAQFAEALGVAVVSLESLDAQGLSSGSPLQREWGSVALRAGSGTNG